MNIVVIYGSVRENRQGIKGAKFIVNKITEAGHEAVLIDPLEYKLPFLAKTYKDYKNDDAPESLKIISGYLKKADGFIVVTGEYNHNIPPALGNMMSHFGSEYKKKPAGIVSYSNGPFAGVRASIAIREFLSALGIVAIPTVFPISGVHTSFDEDGNALDENYNRRIKNFLEEFEWYTEALKNARQKE